jgi:hypothetical protein
MTSYGNHHTDDIHTHTSSSGPTTTSTNTNTNTNTTASSSRMNRFHLVNAPPMKASDLDIPLSLDDMDTIDDFEATWNEFLVQYPHLLSSSTKQRREVLPKLQQALDETALQFHNVQGELQSQLAFFATSKQGLEQRFKQAMTQGTAHQVSIHTDLKRHLDTVAFRDARVTSQTIPWEHFMEVLEHAVVVEQQQQQQQEMTDTAATTSSAQQPNKHSIKPSAKSLFLVDRRPKQAKAVIDPQLGKGLAKPPPPNFEPVAIRNSGSRLLEEADPDVQLRAYRIDHALLSAQVKTLQAELDQFEKNRESMEVIGKILTEHNVWSLINNNNNNSNSSTTTASVVPPPGASVTAATSSSTLAALEATAAARVGSPTEVTMVASTTSSLADLHMNPTNVMANKGGGAGGAGGSSAAGMGSSLAGSSMAASSSR